ncbi:heme-binding domain-containing protein [Chlorobium ferrooxidans]|uniref:Haem-binding domain-containing protein n=1 Tax=Chlorobium ferrooxidans DSM 13031 TaxID=377431 RepID=Q0YUG2_9CHLB|nr:heme-binding domain-containing protein [Chlorobium ferrooxidans]EAT60069.1 hypothetical protein CferDRAFT_2076 [Chlorobium ferrooxidans DSM 13031]
MNYSIKTIASWTVLLLMIIQFIPLRRINPPVQSDLQAPYAVKNSLKKGCYDCHSNETAWPALGYIAPASWLISGSVNSGRNVLNFSLWNNNKIEENGRLKRKIITVLSHGRNHQNLYYTLKPEKALSPKESLAVVSWLDSSY